MKGLKNFVLFLTDLNRKYRTGRTSSGLELKTRFRPSKIFMLVLSVRRVEVRKVVRSKMCNIRNSAKKRNR